MSREDLQTIYAGNEAAFSRYLDENFPGFCFAMLFGELRTEFGLTVVNLFVGFPVAFDYPVVALPIRDWGDRPVIGLRLMDYLFSAPKLTNHVGTALFPQSHFQAGNFLTIASASGDCTDSVIGGLNS